MTLAANNIVQLLIPQELSGLVVQGYKECGRYITPQTASKRKESQERRLKKLQEALEICTSKNEKAQLENEIWALKKANTFKGNRTNNDRKLIGVFICLKAITSSGYISCYRDSEQRAELEQYTKKNFRTIENYIEQLKDLGLVEITGHKYSNGRSLKLASWKKLCDLFGLAFTNEFIVYNYDLDNPKQTPDYVLDGAEELEKQQRLTNRLIRKIKRNHRVRHFLQQYYSVNEINEKVVQQIESMRRSWFVNDFPARSSQDPEFAYCVQWLYSLNTCINRTRTKLKTLRNVLENRTITRLKNALCQRGIANVENIILQSKVGVRVPNRSIQANGYDRSSKCPTWFLPSIVTVKNFSIGTGLQG